MRQGRGRGRGGLLNKVVQGAVSVGAEYRAHRKEVKAASQRSSEQDVHDSVAHDSARLDPATGREVEDDSTPNEVHSDHPDYGDNIGSSTYHDPPPYEEIEGLWQLDEAARSIEEDGQVQDESTDDSLNAAVRSTGNDLQPLPCPVIIPQRRPHEKKRGFVQAYAPVLADSGIDQATFLEFLQKLQKSSQANPIFPIIQISAGIASFAPSLIALAVCTTVQVLATAGAEVQSRHQINTFLDRMNDELFRPRGLYAMIMKYKSKPDANGSLQAQAVDLSTSEIVAKIKSPSDVSNGSWSDRLQSLHLGSGNTRGADALPESAPLIFPNVDHALSLDGGKETLKDRARDAKDFLNDYMDRRAQMKYAASDPQSTLNLPEDKLRMRSNLSNPDHPMFSGNLVDLVTGGALHTREGQQPWRQGSVLDAVQPSARSRDPRAGLGGNSAGGLGGGKGALVKKLLREDILYLLIINMPSEAELAQALRTLDENSR